MDYDIHCNVCVLTSSTSVPFIPVLSLSHFNSSFLRHLSFSLLDSILALYKDLLSRMKADGTKLHQNCAVQYWFDVKVLSSVLVSQEKQGTVSV